MVSLGTCRYSVTGKPHLKDSNGYTCEDWTPVTTQGEQGKKARIKGTEFELVSPQLFADGTRVKFELYKDEADQPWYAMPADWVEFYEPERDEPLEKDRAELDTQSNVWQRFPNGYWYRAGAEANADGSPGNGMSWYGLQESTKYGPTRPMALKEES